MSRLNRRHVLGGGLAAALAPAFAPRLTLAREGDVQVLTAAPATAPLGAPELPDTGVWAYDGQVPGPLIRATAGERVRVLLRNGLDQPTTIHWHGIRIDNAMDGVPHMTQHPAPPGGEFLYDFVAPDAGTFWYHPHSSAWEQVARGLYGPLIVDPPSGPETPRELVAMVDDWRLTEEGQIHESFGSGHDASHAGRLGNWLTVNGRSSPRYPARPGETLRLRLISPANARIMSFDFAGFAPLLLALDAAALDAPEPVDGPVALAPGQRADLWLTMPDAPGVALVHEVSTGEPTDAFAFEIAGDPAAAAAPPPLMPWGQRAPDLSAARVAMLRMEGGAMRWLAQAEHKGEVLDGRALAERGQFWAFNGVADMPPEPLITLRRGETAILAMRNDTRWRHAMHLHGMHFRVVARNGAETLEPWRDTVLMQPGEAIDAAFSADNPGDWMLHCHMLSHAEAGMHTWIRILPDPV